MFFDCAAIIKCWYLVTTLLSDFCRYFLCDWQSVSRGVLTPSFVTTESNLCCLDRILCCEFAPPSSFINNPCIHSCCTHILSFNTTSCHHCICIWEDFACQQKYITCCRLWVNGSCCLLAP